MLFRFRAQQAAAMGVLDVGRVRRPKAITEETSATACEKWRGQVLKEISRKVSKIQEPSLSDFQIRDLNDDINRLMREKHVWELQIRNLGGPNYMRGGGKVFDEDGIEIPGGGKGYRYFGRARELPGVKEMFDAQKAHIDAVAEGKTEVRHRNVDASYYGYNLDEEDGSLLAYEGKKEADAREALQAEIEDSEPDWQPLPGDAGDGLGWRLPTMEQVQEELVDRRRQTLLDKLG